MDNMNQEKLFSLTRSKLIKLAQGHKIKNYGRLRKQELVEKLLASDKSAKQAPRPQSVDLHPAPQPEEPRPYHEQEEIEDTKYYLGPDASGWEAKEELPSNYGDNKVVLLVRNPYWLYAYWEISPQRLAQAKLDLENSWEGCKRILRVYDITGREFNGGHANSYFDIEIDGTENWYIKVDKPKHSFCADLGLLTPRGSFYFLAQSNQVTTPQDSPSVLFDEEWWSSHEGGEGRPPEKCFLDWEKELYNPLSEELASGAASLFSKR